MAILDPVPSGNQEASAAPQQQGSGSQAPQSAASNSESVPEWLSDVEESLKGDKSLHKFSGDKWKENLAKSYVALEKKLGSSVQIPKEDAPQEEWEKYFSRIGRPESPDKYVVPGELPDAVKAKVLQEAFSKSVTPKQLEAIVSAFQEGSKDVVAQGQASQQQEYESAVATLKSEYGNDFDANVRLASKALHGLFPAGAAAILERNLGNDPRIIKDLVALGKRLGEDKIVSGMAAPASAPHPYDWMRKEFKGGDQ